MKKWVIPGCVVLLLSLIGLGNMHALAQSAGRADPDNSKQLFLLIGQSNMAGRGSLDSIGKVVTPHIYNFDKALDWVAATDPLHFDKPGVAGVGPGLAFAREIAKAYPVAEIGLIPCAVGGTSISRWQPGAYDPATKTHPYDDAIRRARAALKSGTLRGILWHQGEGDRGKDLYMRYELRFDSLYANLQRDLGINLDTIPVLLGELGPFYKSPASKVQTQRIDSVLHSIAAKHPNMACVSAEGLKHRGDTLHFDATSARELGRRYAFAYLQLKLGRITRQQQVSGARKKACLAVAYVWPTMTIPFPALFPSGAKALANGDHQKSDPVLLTTTKDGGPSIQRRVLERRVGY